MTTIVSFAMRGKDYVILDSDVEKWDLSYSNNGVLLTLYNYKLVDTVCDISNVCIMGQYFDEIPAVIGPAGENTKLIVIRRHR